MNKPVIPIKLVAASADELPLNSQLSDDFPTKVEAGKFLASGLRECSGNLPAATASEAVADALGTHYHLTAELIEKQKGTFNKGSLGSLFDADGDHQAADAEDEEMESPNAFWEIPYQARIAVRPVTADEIEIEQDGQHGSADDDGGRIFVTRQNAVGLARRLLWAAGFKHVLIATSDGGGGFKDIEDGDTREKFTRGGE